MFIGGTQKLGGTVERHVVVDPIHPDFPLTVEQAIQLGQPLVELGEEAQQMAWLDKQMD